MTGINTILLGIGRSVALMAETMATNSNVPNTVRNLFDGSREINIDWKSFLSKFEYLQTIYYNDVLDIILVAFVLYHVMRLLRDTSGERLVKGVLVLVVIMFLASVLKLVMINYILERALGYGLLVIAVIFQPELRRLLEQLGKGNLSQMFMSNSNTSVINSAIDATVASCVDMSKTKTGALIVFERRDRIGDIIKTGTQIDAEPSAELIKNVFYPKSPLHDGAVVVRNGRVYAAGCVLPLSGSQTLSRDLGTRHRAAVGMSESSDGVLVVVSEETGSISVAIDGMLKRHLSGDLLHKILTAELLPDEETPKSRRKKILRSIRKGDKK